MFKQVTRTSNLNTCFRLRSNGQFNKLANNQASRPFFMKLTKKNFLTKNPLSLIMPITRSLVAGNILMWCISGFYDPKDYITKFFYSADSVQKGKIHTLLTSHFAKERFLDVVVDSLIVGVIGNHVETLIGTPMMRNLLILSALTSIAIVYASAKKDEYFSLETTGRMALYMMAFKNPNYIVDFLLFRTRFVTIAGIIAVIDGLSGKLSNLGPLLACFALTRGKTI